MYTKQHQPETLSISSAREQLDTLVIQVSTHEARVRIEHSDGSVAALVSAEDLDRLQRLDQERDERFHVIDEVRTVFTGLPAAEIDDEADRAIAEVRADISPTT